MPKSIILNQLGVYFGGWADVFIDAGFYEMAVFQQNWLQIAALSSLRLLILYKSSYR